MGRDVNGVTTRGLGGGVNIAHFDCDTLLASAAASYCLDTVSKPCLIGAMCVCARAERERKRCPATEREQNTFISLFIVVSGSLDDGGYGQNKIHSTRGLFFPQMVLFV